MSLSNALIESAGSISTKSSNATNVHLRGESVSMRRFEIFHTPLWCILNLLWKISYVNDTPSRLDKHSKLPRFENGAAKTRQHGQKYGDTVMLYGRKYTCE